MHYNIKSGVYIVRGAVKSNIYDCNNDKHFWVDNAVIDDLVKLINREFVDEETISDAISLDLIESSSESSPQALPDISDLFDFARHHGLN